MTSPVMGKPAMPACAAQHTRGRCRDTGGLNYINGALADARTPACREAAIACDGERARTLNHRLRIKADAAIPVNSSPGIDAASGKNIFHRWPGEAVAENIVMVDLLSTLIAYGHRAAMMICPNGLVLNQRVILV
jgi:hypothetical protein